MYNEQTFPTDDRFRLLSIIAQEAGDSTIIANTTILLKLFEELKHQVKRQKQFFRLFEEQNKCVRSDKLSSVHAV